MKKKIMSGFAATSMLAIVGFSSSCKDDEEKAKNNLIGTWDVSYIASDDNVNGALDEDEKEIVPDTAAFTFTFKDGGSGETVITPSKASGVSTTVPFTWSMNNDATTVTITAAGDVNVVDIITLNNSTFNGVYGTGKDKTWIYATK